mmetsp:Transcript_80570/g.232909  ORF Transcript_80570/g.232909 Transcript_80570/m.232909 type:complete len:217 (+) Transcript_80570:367-1017(+)
MSIEGVVVNRRLTEAGGSPEEVVHGARQNFAVLLGEGPVEVGLVLRRRRGPWRRGGAWPRGLRRRVVHPLPSGRVAEVRMPRPELPLRAQKPEPRQHHREALPLDPLHEERRRVHLQPFGLVSDRRRLQQRLSVAKNPIRNDRRAAGHLLVKIRLLPGLKPLPIRVQLDAEDADERGGGFAVQAFTDVATSAKDTDIADSASHSNATHQLPILAEL